MQPASTTRPESERTAEAAPRWFGVGHSRAEDPYLRGREALLAATAQAFDDPVLVVVFADLDPRMADLLDGVRRAVRGSPAIVGCTTNGELTPAGPIDQGVCVIAIGGPGFEVRTAVGPAISADQRAAGSRVGHALEGLDRPHRVLMLLSDGMAAQHDLIRGVYGVTGAGVPLVGGSAGDGMAFERTYQFHGDAAAVEILSDAVVGVALGSDAPIGIGIDHGWRKAGEPMTITSSSGGRIYELDGERAFDVFLRRCGTPPLDLADRRALGHWSHRHPFGMSRRSGEDIRTLHDVDPVGGSLTCLADVQQGALAWLMETDERSLIDCAARSCRQAMSENPSGRPIGMVVFDCCARKTRLGPEGVIAEVQGMTRAVDGVPFGGFYTFGEIARVHGARGMHQLTVVCLALW